jgi:hypothetical protein
MIKALVENISVSIPSSKKDVNTMQGNKLSFIKKF